MRVRAVDSVLIYRCVSRFKAGRDAAMARQSQTARQLIGPDVTAGSYPGEGQR